MSFPNRVLIGFLAVPWLPMIFFLPYFLFAGVFPNGKSIVVGAIAVSAFFAGLTYILEVTIALPVWRYFLKAGRVSLSWFVATGLALAFGYSFVAIGLLTGFEQFRDLALVRVIFFSAAAGAVEAAVFWFFVRPDKYNLEQATPKHKQQDSGN